MLQNNNTNNNRLVVPGVEQSLEQMKMEIATELGVSLGADATSRDNGRVGGEMTRRLVKLAEEQLRQNNHLQ